MADIQCKICQKSCSQLSNLNTHWSLVHSEEEVKKLKCTICERKFVRKCDLNWQTNSFGSNNEKRHGSKSFQTAGSLKTRENIHNIVK